MKRIYSILITAIILTLLGCGNAEKEVNTNSSIEHNTDERIKVSKAQFKVNKMLLGAIEEKPFSVGIKVNGMVDVPAENKAVVNSITGGYIKTIPLLVGDVVKKGQVLVTIENPEFVQMQQDYMEVKEQLNYLKTEYERQNQMYKEDIISKKVFLKAESQYKTANAKHKGLKKQLTMVNISPSRVEQGHITSVVNIYAPIGGSITKVNTTKGAYVSPTTSILEIIDNDHIHIELSVFEKDIMTVKKDQKIIFTIPEISDKSFEAFVYLVGTSIQDNRTIKVHAHPKDETQTFLTGMFVNAEIIVEESNSKALPEQTFVEIEDDYYVLVLDEENDTDYYFNKQKVALENTTNGYTKIKDENSLNATGKFLVNGAFGLIGNE